MKIRTTIACEVLGVACVALAYHWLERACYVGAWRAYFNARGSSVYDWAWQVSLWVGTGLIIAPGVAYLAGKIRKRRSISKVG